MSWSLINIGSTSDLAIREVCFTKITSIKLDEKHIDKELYKKAKYDTQKLIATKKWALFDEKISASWNTLKSLVMPKKTVDSNFDGIDNNKSLTYDKSLQVFLLKVSRISSR